VVYAVNGKVNTVTVETGQEVELPPKAAGDKPAEKPAEKPAGQEKPLKLDDVISQELQRRKKELAAQLRDPTFNPSDATQTIPDPHAKTKALLESLTKERQALHGTTVEGTAEFLKANRNAAGAWIVMFRLRVPKNTVKFAAFASDDIEPVLRKLKVGQKVKVKGKIEGNSFGGQEFSLFACTFADLEGERGQAGPADQNKH
jgi:hypothetical protein